MKIVRLMVFGLMSVGLMSAGQMGVEPKGSRSGLLGIESFKQRRAAARAAQLSKVQKRRAAEAAQLLYALACSTRTVQRQSLRVVCFGQIVRSSRHLKIEFIAL